MSLSLRMMMVASALSAGACGIEKLDEGEGGGRIPDDVHRILVDSCALNAACHAPPATAAQGLDLTTTQLDDLVGRTAAQSGTPLLEFGNIAGSYLAVKILEPPPEGVVRSGAVMPQPPGVLTPEDQAILLGWIAGANLPAGGTGSADTGPATDGGSTGETLMLCGVDDAVTSGAKTIDRGMAAGQIPPDIGDVLSNNCGCHYAGTLAEGYAAPPDPMVSPAATDLTQLSTIQAGRMTVLDRVSREDPLQMPHFTCDLGGGEVITAADQDLLTAWLEMDPLPDGATWTPPG